MSKLSAIKDRASLALHQMKTAANSTTRIRDALKSIPKAELKEALKSDEGMEVLGHKIATKLQSDSKSNQQVFSSSYTLETFIASLKNQRAVIMKKASLRKKYLGESADMSM